MKRFPGLIPILIIVGIAFAFCLAITYGPRMDAPITNEQVIDQNNNSTWMLLLM